MNDEIKLPSSNEADRKSRNDAILGKIKHSIRQARIPGNDWRRELAPIEGIVDAQLSTDVQPAASAEPTWHVPGIGEVHSSDHKSMIYCEAEDAEGEMVVSDSLAQRVCNALKENFRSDNGHQSDPCPDCTQANAGISDDSLSAVECCITDYENDENTRTNRAILSGLKKAHAMLELVGNPNRLRQNTDKAATQKDHTLTFVHELAIGTYSPEEIEARAKAIAKMTPLDAQPGPAMLTDDWEDGLSTLLQKYSDATIADDMGCRNRAYDAIMDYVRKRVQPASVEDAERLNYLQRGVTVSLAPNTRSGEPDWYFRVGGLYASDHIDIRAAIDAARRQEGQS